MLLAREDQATVSRTRAPADESVARLKLGFVRADNDYQAGAAEAAPSDRIVPSTSHTEVPIVVSEGEAHVIVEKWLTEAQTARETITFALPPSMLGLSVGDVFSVKGGNPSERFRVDRIEERDMRTVEAVRTDLDAYQVPIFRLSKAKSSSLSAATPVYAQLLDLPLLTGEERPHAPHVAVAKRPWRGKVVVLSAGDEQDRYTLAGTVSHPATVGETLNVLPAGAPGLWMPASFRVRLDQGLLESRSKNDVLNGANVAAHRYGQWGQWELIQFQSAELIAPQTYRLETLLRGQAGTDGIMPGLPPSGGPG